MNIHIPSWTFAAHLAVPALFILGEYLYDGESPHMGAQKISRMALEALAFGTLVSTAVAFGSPSILSADSFIPSALRKGAVVLTHLFASTIGLVVYKLVRPSDDAK